MSLSVIAIGGPHGSGKSSVAKQLAEEFDMNYVAAGDVFRQIAKEQGYSMKEFSELVINRPEIDREIDERTKKLGSQPNTIVDAQLAAHFTPAETALKICITASPDIRYQRIADREERTFEDSKAETIVRERTEKQRFLDLYDINIDDNSVYDVIINNDRLDEETTLNLAKALIKTALNR